MKKLKCMTAILCNMSACVLGPSYTSRPSNPFHVWCVILSWAGSLCFACLSLSAANGFICVNSMRVASLKLTVRNIKPPKTITERPKQWVHNSFLHLKPQNSPKMLPLLLNWLQFKSMNQVLSLPGDYIINTQNILHACTSVLYYLTLSVSIGWVLFACAALHHPAGWL